MQSKMNSKAYSTFQISQWQKEVSGIETKIKLPSLQRGFVWKAAQIENLWDSIFRGYPIGAILMSIDSDENRNLLDGQQRCTTIALGHFNPFDENLENFLSLSASSYKPSIWLDLKKNDQNNGKSFNFRCLTQSHPWGYQLRDSSATLSMSDRNKAINYFRDKSNTEKHERYTDLKSKFINPWDAFYPIPLALILEIEAKDEIEFLSTLRIKIKQLNIKTKYSSNNFVNYNDLQDADLSFIFEGFKNSKKLTIPEILIDSNILKEDNQSSEDTEDATLFVRLNSAGTRITGEELNYSIYKAYFPKLKNLVEEIGASYIAPSKIISLFSRLSSFEQSGFSQYQKEFSIQTFKKKFSEEPFRNVLQKNINGNAHNLIQNAISILQNGDKSFPKILLKQIIVVNNDLFFVLLAYITKYNYNSLNEAELKHIASSYLYILWFSREPKKIANSLFYLLLDDDINIDPWKYALDKLIEENKVLPVIKPEILRKNLENIVINKKIDSNDIQIQHNNLLCDDLTRMLTTNQTNDSFEKWNLLVSKICWNKSLLLYAQRDYLNSKFQEFNQFDSIEDTNRPWDWDHIYPNSWVYNKPGINYLVKSWVNTIGNIRALSYDDNRSENNYFSPMMRLCNDSKKEESFINENDFIFWNLIDDNFRRVKDDTYQVEIFLNAVITRMVNIYENWYINYFINNSQK